MTEAKRGDLAGPGMSTYEKVAEILPSSYEALMGPRKTMLALFEAKSMMTEGLNKELNLINVEVPLIVENASGQNDNLDRDGSRTPVAFQLPNDGKNTMDVSVVQAATKWKRIALKEFECQVGQGINTDMRAIRKNYFLDHDHSCYVSQWDWELVISEKQRSVEFLKEVVKKIWSVIVSTDGALREKYPELRSLSPVPQELTFVHAEDVLKKWPDLPRKQRETELVKEHKAVFIIGIGWTLADGFPHEMRAADYDDWVTPTGDGSYHGLNGDILVWNSVTQRRHELSSMGIRVNAEQLKQQCEMTNQLDNLKLPYHEAVMKGELPPCIGGGIGQTRLYMWLLGKAHLGEVSVCPWPKALRDICAEKNIHVLQ